MNENKFTAKDYLHTAAQLTWGLPQSLIGLAWLAAWRAKNKDVKMQWRRGILAATSPAYSGGISLGLVTIAQDDVNTLNHEFGHCLQSLLLGPFYLPVIALPSLILNIFYRLGRVNIEQYYQFYTERWADKWGGVVREKMDMSQMTAATSPTNDEA